jgi:hypothetical protein
MPPTTGYDPIAIGSRLFTSFAVILLAWYGIKWMFGGGDPGERVFGFGMIASAVCALLGPLFIPFFIVPTPSSSSSNASSAAFCKRCPPACASRISCSTASTSS